MADETPAGTGGTGDTAAAAAAATAAAATAAANKPWYDGADTELVGYIQNRGLDKMEPKAAALAEAKAHREAERLLGVPADQLLRFPKDANDKEGWAKIHARLGVPTDAKEYDFTAVKTAAGQPIGETIANTLRAAAGEAALTKDQAAAVAKSVVKLFDETEATKAAEYAIKLDAEKASLKTNWGQNATANLIVAQNAATKLGVTPAELSALESVVGYSRVMEMFRTVGSKIGEDVFVNGGPGGGNQPVSKEAAQQRLDELGRDQDWQAKFNKGDVKALQEFNNLTRMVAGV
jgi:hypothetical protein